MVLRLAHELIKSSGVWVSTEKRIRQNAKGIEEEPAMS